ncbi:MAG: quinone-dependent dihydroorotate dehydrogenase, partial [Burkholderiaceae bacterium]
VTMGLLPLLHASGLLRLTAGKPVSDPVELMGIQFPNRIGLAAGLDKNARHLRELMAMGFGFVEAGTVTPQAQPGNPKPRMFRLPQRNAVINRMGFNNEGLVAFENNVRRLVASTSSAARPVLGLNIGKNATTPIDNAVNDYLLGLRGVYPYADYVAINISSPNTANLRELQQQNELDNMLSALSQEREQLSRTHGRRVPLTVKIAPDLTPEQATVIARTLPAHNIDGVIATNTTLSRDAVSGIKHGNEKGGLSGAPVKEMSNNVIRLLRAELPPGFPIIGVGGIMSRDDARDKLEAGADLLQLYTGLIYQGPALVNECAETARFYFRDLTFELTEATDASESAD